MKLEKNNRSWIKYEIEVPVPCKGSREYRDILIYLVKVVDVLDPRFSIVVGLLSYIFHNGKFDSSEQRKLADDIIMYYKENGYLEKENKYEAEEF